MQKEESNQGQDPHTGVSESQHRGMPDALGVCARNGAATAVAFDARAQATYHWHLHPLCHHSEQHWCSTPYRSRRHLQARSSGHVNFQFIRIAGIESIFKLGFSVVERVNCQCCHVRSRSNSENCNSGSENWSSCRKHGVEGT